MSVVFVNSDMQRWEVRLVLSLATLQPFATGDRRLYSAIVGYVIAFCTATAMVAILHKWSGYVVRLCG